VWHAWPVRTTVCLALSAALLAGCGSGSGPPSAAPRPAEAARSLAGSPPPLVALHRDANRLLGGGPGALRARLRGLRGHPVVVNKWASWCGPCRAEFPFFQRLSVELGRSVAFIGVNSNDSDGDARAFLRRYPVSYPSYSDPDQKVAKVFAGPLGFPSTAFYDAAGKLTFVHQGEYASEAKLREDIRRYGGPLGA
jgi:cytochrome c biogenesis protein CcmG, thiol:disulfide interchange protein DsbE